MTIPPGEWHAALATAHAEGFALLDLLTAIDRHARLEVVARVVDPGSARSATIRTLVEDPHPELDTVTDLFPSAAWHERETAEMFGLAFAGSPDPRPLLLADAPPDPPLRRSTPLDARLRLAWPGAAEPSGGRARRPVAPPGVHREWST